MIIVAIFGMVLVIELCYFCYEAGYMKAKLEDLRERIDKLKEN
jgi:hypothetical protein